MPVPNTLVNEVSGETTALHMATGLGLEAVVRVLLENGALLDEKDSRGLTALLMYASSVTLNFWQLT